ncbi:MAG: hypothetical protein HY673_16935 [Chloroflexi bacterium]|nr:hypothetical protein [Chloroflexota bacterium]
MDSSVAVRQLTAGFIALFAIMVIAIAGFQAISFHREKGLPEEVGVADGSLPAAFSNPP